MKKGIMLAIILVLSLIIVLFFVNYLFFADKKTSPDASNQLIGGQKDSHGCLIPAGYSWCETKQKCLREWEESCESESESLIEDEIIYTNDKYKFQIKMPLSWEGYRANSGDYPTYSYVGYSFGEPHRPFEIFKIVSFTNEQWSAISNKTLFTVLEQADNQIFTCDGCCTKDSDTSGGGQFDQFQTERCEEVPEIIKSFKIIN